jgi:ubiquinone biosynthesis monooxygenase Coq7
MTSKKLSHNIVDAMITQVDLGLRTLFAKPVAKRANPASKEPEANLSSSEARHSAGLMRINHVGEVCAQALYAGQALTGRQAEVREKMREAAAEEVDHLAWCDERLRSLNSHTSYLNPLWFAGSFALGVTAGLIGDRWSLGFVAETENQVVRHLDSHLTQLPEKDLQSRAIVTQIREDEAKHATTALAAGGKELPSAIKFAMAAMSKVMTSIAYWV